MAGRTLKYCVRIEPLSSIGLNAVVIYWALCSLKEIRALRSGSQLTSKATDRSHGLNVKLGIHAFKPSFIMAPIIGKSRAGHGVYFEDFLIWLAIQLELI
jgi:hypothetical protein